MDIWIGYGGRLYRYYAYLDQSEYIFFILQSPNKNLRNQKITFYHSLPPKGLKELESIFIVKDNFSISYKYTTTLIIYSNPVRSNMINCLLND